MAIDVYIFSSSKGECGLMIDILDCNYTLRLYCKNSGAMAWIKNLLLIYCSFSYIPLHIQFSLPQFPAHFLVSKHVINFYKIQPRGEAVAFFLIPFTETAYHKAVYFLY